MDITFKKSYLSTHLGYLKSSFNIQKLMTCSQIIIFVKYPPNCRAGHLLIGCGLCSQGEYLAVVGVQYTYMYAVNWI